MLKSDVPIIMEIPVSASVEAIWSALTDPDQLRNWFFEVIPDFKPEVGFETTFDISNGSQNFPHVWRVVEVIPKEKLVVNWTFEGYEGSSNVSFEVFNGQESNSIRLSTEILEDHRQDIPEFRRESGVGGWHYFMQDRLKNHLAG